MFPAFLILQIPLQVSHGSVYQCKMPGNSTASLSYLSETNRSFPGTMDPHHWHVSPLPKSKEIKQSSLLSRILLQLFLTDVADTKLPFSSVLAGTRLCGLMWCWARFILLGGVLLASSLCPGCQRCLHPIRKCLWPGRADSILHLKVNILMLFQCLLALVSHCC